MKNGKPEELSARFRKWLIGVAIIWSVVVVGLFMHDVTEINRFTFEMAKKEAVTNFSKDQAARLWAADHGGVYVPVTAKVQPNPYLKDIPDRDVNTPNGMLTLMNPAYMLREMMQQYEGLYGNRGHITSLKYTRKETAPDDWEKATLLAFEHGQKEVCEISSIKEVPYLRLMRPLLTEEDCLKCHRQQGHKIGDIRGGVSISIPFKPFQALQRQSTFAHGISFAVLWLLGLTGISVAGKSLNRHLRERQKTEDQYASIISNSLTGIYMIQDGRIVFANQQFADLYGYLPEEVIGMDALAFVHPEDRSFVKNQRERRFAGESVPYAYEARSIRKTGECIWVQRRISVIDYQGNPAILGNILNISPLKKAEAAMKLSGEELKQKNRELEAFTSVAAHDLREPLRKIEAFGNLLASQCGPELNDESRDYLHRMQNAAVRMTSLIDSLLDYSRPSTKAVPLKMVDLNMAVTSAVSNLGVRLSETNGFVETGDLPTVAADELQMIQLFQNLIGNSLKFRQPELPPRVKITSRPAGSAAPGEPVTVWEIFVEDNGIGFEEKFVDAIFAPFERLHAKSEYEGTGIGLAICRKIVARHGGTLTARSTPGKGSTFIVMLPVREEIPQPPGAPGSDV